MIRPPVDFMPPFSLLQALEANFKKSKQHENAKQKTTKQMENRKGRRKRTRSRAQKENTTINKKKDEGTGRRKEKNY